MATLRMMASEYQDSSPELIERRIVKTNTMASVIDPINMIVIAIA